MKPTPPDRIPCLVVGCRRTAPRSRYPGENVIIICGKCWRLTSKHLRRRVRKVERIMRKMGLPETVSWGDTKPGSRERLACVLHARIFEKIAAQATEARMGIG